jgi:hypothetical protein
MYSLVRLGIGIAFVPSFLDFKKNEFGFETPFQCG